MTQVQRVAAGSWSANFMYFGAVGSTGTNAQPGDLIVLSIFQNACCDSYVEKINDGTRWTKIIDNRADDIRTNHAGLGIQAFAKVITAADLNDAQGNQVYHRVVDPNGLTSYATGIILRGAHPTSPIRQAAGVLSGNPFGGDSINYIDCPELPGELEDMRLTISDGINFGELLSAEGGEVQFTFNGSNNPNSLAIEPITEAARKNPGRRRHVHTTSESRRVAGTIIVRSANLEPNPVTVLAPADGATLPMNTQTTTFDWTWGDADASDTTQGAYSLFRNLVDANGTRLGPDEWWNAATNSWVGALVNNPSTTDAVQFGPGVWPPGRYRWRVRVLDSSGAASTYSSSRFVTSNAAPTAPTLGPPANGSAPDLTTPTFTWKHNDAEGNPQGQYAFRRRLPGGAYEYWNAASGVFQSTEVFNSGSAQSITFAAGRWTPGTTYQWSVRTVDTGSQQAGPWAADFTVQAQSPPNAPILVDPPNASTRDLKAGYTFDWEFSDPNGSDVQSAFAFRRKLSGASAYEWINTATGAWQSTEYWVPGSTTSMTFGPSASLWAAGQYGWSVATKDDGGRPGAYSADRIVVSSVAPTVVVTAPVGRCVPATAPVGTVAGTQRPTVVWSYSDPEGTPQTGFQVKIFTDAQYNDPAFNPNSSPATVDSTELSGTATSYALPQDLAIDVSYRAYVRVAHPGQYSGWAYSAFMLGLDLPAVPTITTSADGDLGSVAIVVQGRDNLFGVNRSTFETSVADWSSTGNATLARTVAPGTFFGGSAALALTAVAAGNASARSQGGEARPTVVPGRRYSATIRVKPVQTGRTAILQLRFINEAENQVTSEKSTTIANLSTAVWTEVAVADAVADALASRVEINVVFSGPVVAGDVLYVDQTAIKPGIDSTWTRGGLAGITSALVEYSDDNGATWITVRGAAAVPLPVPAQSATVFDNEAPPNTPRLYRASTFASV